MIPEGLAEELRRAAGRLTASAGLGRPLAAEPLAGGANNRVFRLDTEGGPAVLKAYFHHPDDPRDRLAAEWAFLRLLWDGGVRTVPQPLALNRAHRLGLYAYIDGRRLGPEEGGAGAVAAALDFLEALSRLKGRAAGVASASEACFLLAEHLRAVGARVDRLGRIAPDGALHRDAARLVAGRIVPLWSRLLDRTRRTACAYGLDPEAELPAGERCLSPSDFGFHNALRRADGGLVFLDFEYAGWDDPAKLVGDVFNQVAVPVADVHYPAFRDTVASWSGEPERMARRIDLLLPVYAVKWVAILLNDFLPVGEIRRGFAGGPGAVEARRLGQLDKVRAALARIETGLQDREPSWPSIV